MIAFALGGITSFSVKPLKLISNLGILISVLSVFGLIYALISFFAGCAVSGWTAIVPSIWLLGGLQMPVSYTHLDVYKRQSFSCAACSTSR